MSSRGEASHSFVRLNGSDLHIGKSVINGRALVLSVFVIFVLMTIVRHQQLWRASRQIGNYKSEGAIMDNNMDDVLRVCEEGSEVVLNNAPSLMFNDSLYDVRACDSADFQSISKRDFSMAIVSLAQMRPRLRFFSQQRELVQFSVNNKLQYASLHAIPFFFYHNAMIGANLTVHWSKFLVLAHYLPHYDWLVWMDNDAIFANFQKSFTEVIQLASPHHDVIISKDWNGINSGVFLLRNSPFSKRLLRDCYQMHQNAYLRKSKFYEQESLAKYLGQAEHAKRVLLVPQIMMNAYHPVVAKTLGRDPEYGEPWKYENGHFIVHFPGVHFYQVIRSLRELRWDGVCATNKDVEASGAVEWLIGIQEDVQSLEKYRIGEKQQDIRLRQKGRRT